MSPIKRIGLDTSKAVFTLHCVDETGKAVLRTNVHRAQMVTFFKNLAPVEIALEACACSHHWARELTALGHEKRLLPRTPVASRSFASAVRPTGAAGSSAGVTPSAR